MTETAEERLARFAAFERDYRAKRAAEIDDLDWDAPDDETVPACCRCHYPVARQFALALIGPGPEYTVSFVCGSCCKHLPNSLVEAA